MKSNKPLLQTPKKWSERYALVSGLAAQQNDETLDSAFSGPDDATVLRGRVRGNAAHLDRGRIETYRDTSEMNSSLEERDSLADYLLQLRQELASLERFPKTSYSHAAVLALSLPILLAGYLGFALLPVPQYLLLPFALIPTWTLGQRELRWRADRRGGIERIHVIENRLAGLSRDASSPND